MIAAAVLLLSGLLFFLCHTIAADRREDRELAAAEAELPASLPPLFRVGL